MPAKNPLPPASELRQLFDYDPISGVVTYRARGAEHFTHIAERIRAPNVAAWNTRWAGRPAGTIVGSGYMHVTIKSHPVSIHRLIWAYVHGYWPTNDIDHINGVRTDNRIVNLREVSRAVNLRNRCR